MMPAGLGGLPPDAPSLAFPTINAQGKKVVTLSWTEPTR